MIIINELAVYVQALASSYLPPLFYQSGHDRQFHRACLEGMTRSKGKRGTSTKTRGGTTAGKKRKAATQPEEGLSSMNDRQPVQLERGWAEMEVRGIVTALIIELRTSASHDLDRGFTCYF